MFDYSHLFSIVSKKIRTVCFHVPIFEKTMSSILPVDLAGYEKIHFNFYNSIKKKFCSTKGVFFSFSTDSEHFSTTKSKCHEFICEIWDILWLISFQNNPEYENADILTMIPKLLSCRNLDGCHQSAKIGQQTFQQHEIRESIQFNLKSIRKSAIKGALSNHPHITTGFSHAAQIYMNIQEIIFIFCIKKIISRFSFRSWNKPVSGK